MNDSNDVSTAGNNVMAKEMLLGVFPCPVESRSGLVWNLCDALMNAAPAL